MKIYLVGGAVRDELLGLPVSDKDFVVVGSTPEEMILNGFRQVGSGFPVFLHPKTNDEYALARTEQKINLGYTGFNCYSAPDVKIEDDLLRRDLTINAIAKDENGKLIDPYNGLNDINKRILRHVSSAFVEDSLRILRVARFAARFHENGFTIASETMKLMKYMINSNELLHLSGERIWLETEKALKSNFPYIYINVLRQCGALAILFPEINNLFSISSVKKMHTKTNVGTHTMMVLQCVSGFTNNISIRFSALCHDFNKLLMLEGVSSSYLKNNQYGVSIAKRMCKRIRVPKYICNFACFVIRFHNMIHIVNKLTSEEIINIFDNLDAWRKSYIIEQLIIISKADAYIRNFNVNKRYFQGEYFRKAFNIAKSINVKNIMFCGFKGIEIREELRRQRIKILEIWKQKEKN